MAGSYNRVILVGTLTRDPEIRYVQSGSAVTNFSIAVNRRTKGGDETTYVDIVAWDSGNYKLAEICNTYLKKGMSVLVEGRLVIRSYEDKAGNKRKQTEIVIDNMQMLDRAANATGATTSTSSLANGRRSPSPRAGAKPSYTRGHRDDPAPDGGGSGSTTLDEELLDEIPFRHDFRETSTRWWLR
jgi:single-strand DNA-binding protein